MFHRSFYWILFFFSQVCYGQVSSGALHFDHLTISDGLSHNTIYSIIQDHHGYIWIGTQNGLNKYDGYAFKVYGTNELEGSNEGFIGKTISALFEDKHNNLWVGTQKNGINFRAKSTDRFQNLRVHPAFAAIEGSDITSFYEDEAGNIWVTTIGAGVLKYHPETGTSQMFNQENNGLSSNITFDIVEDQYGTIWVAGAGGGISYLTKNNQFELSHEMLPNHPNMSGYRKKMLLDGEFLWVGTQGTGLYKMNIKDRSYIHFAPGNGKRSISSNVVKDLHKTKDGRLFIATDGKGLNVYDPLTEEISLFEYKVGEKNALNSNALLCMWEDRTENIWIGTYNGGINIYKPKKTWFDFFAPSLTRENDLQHRSILSILESQNGNVLLGTDGAGLNQLTFRNNEFIATSLEHKPDVTSSIGGNVIKTIFRDSKNRIWVGVFGVGLDLYEPATNSFQHVIQEPINIWSIAERKDGKLFIATMGNGIRVFDPETQQTTLFKPKFIEPNIMTIFIDRTNQVWMGTANDGLLLWDEVNDALVRYQNDPTDSLSISNNEIRTIYQDSQGEMWIGTEGGGLNRWLGGKQFERIDVKNGLVANSIMGITEDNEGWLWISTFEGISRINKQTRSIRNFDFRNYQNTNQFNQDAIITASTGKLFFGGINGLNAIYPKNVKKNEKEPEIIFTDLKVYNKSVSVGEIPDRRPILEKPIEYGGDIWLSYLDQSFSIDFTAIDYTNPLENQFAYQMEGFHEDWQYTSPGQHSLTYTNLDPGTYIFKVKNKKNLASLQVHIRPPYWKTTWFRLLVVICSIALLFSSVFIWIKRRDAAHKRKILQLQNEKLATEVEAKNSKLMFSSVQIAHKNEILTELKNSLIGVEKKPEASFRSLIRKLDHELKNEDYWKEFNLYFNEVDQKFLDRIVKMHPALTKNDLRMCSLLRMNLSTKEIASLLNISIRAVEQSRYRLKKRLGLEKAADLSKYIASFHRES